MVVTDVNDYRLDLARKLGATPDRQRRRGATCRTSMKELGMVGGFDVGLEMSRQRPRPSSRCSTNMYNGGRIALLGILPSGTRHRLGQGHLQGALPQGHLRPRDVRDLVQDAGHAPVRPGHRARSSPTGTPSTTSRRASRTCSPASPARWCSRSRRWSGLVQNPAAGHTRTVNEPNKKRPGPGPRKDGRRPAAPGHPAVPGSRRPPRGPRDPAREDVYRPGAGKPEGPLHVRHEAGDPIAAYLASQEGVRGGGGMKARFVSPFGAPGNAASDIDAFLAAVSETFPVQESRREYLKDDVLALWRDLTSERSLRFADYLGKPSALAAYVRYFMAWNVVRLVPVLAEPAPGSRRKAR
ncbi:MAG: hypothetical protein MZU95_15690 [Desulfomicrobium escambiense]|nr:hypothetical protein [Desulfomicrobium escambiense]